MLASMFSGMGHFIISNQGNPYVRAPGKVPSAQGWEEGLGKGEGVNNAILLRITAKVRGHPEVSSMKYYVTLNSINSEGNGIFSTQWAI